MSSDSYTGIYDSEASIIQSMSSSAFAPTQNVAPKAVKP